MENTRQHLLTLYLKSLQKRLQEIAGRPDSSKEVQDLRKLIKETEEKITQSVLR